MNRYSISYIHHEKNHTHKGSPTPPHAPPGPLRKAPAGGVMGWGVFLWLYSILDTRCSFNCACLFLFAWHTCHSMTVTIATLPVADLGSAPCRPVSQARTTARPMPGTRRPRRMSSRASRCRRYGRSGNWLVATSSRRIDIAQWDMAHSLARSLTHSLTHPPTHSLTHACTHACTRACVRVLTRAVTMLHAYRRFLARRCRCSRRRLCGSLASSQPRPRGPRLWPT